MVNMMDRDMQLRPAIAMIELIFALVVMGITLLSAPLILSMTTKSAATAISQESIAATASNISLILTHAWAEMDSNDTTGYGILDTTNGDPELARGTRLSSETRGYMRRAFNVAPYNNASLPNTFGQFNDALNNNDIDDYDGLIQRLRIYNNIQEVSSLNANEGEYIKGRDFTMRSDVIYGSDAAIYQQTFINFNNPFTPLGAGLNISSNIKLVTVTLQPINQAALNPDLNQTITMRAFACNIGNSRLDYPIEIQEVP